MKFIPNIKTARVVSCYDGDTVTIGVKNTSGMYKFPLRLRGIDTPEIKGGSESEKKAAKFVRDKLRNKILGSIIRITDLSYDKYGRLLGQIYLDDIDISKWLLDNKYAVKYEGGTKYDVDWSYLNTLEQL